MEGKVKEVGKGYDKRERARGDKSAGTNKPAAQQAKATVARKRKGLGPFTQDGLKAGTHTH